MARSPATIKFQDEPMQLLLQPVVHIKEIPGKNMRSLLSKAFNCWLKIPKDKLEKIDEILDLIHTSTLIMDDVQDNSVMRRGVPSSFMIYGIPATVNTVNYMGFCLALEKIQDLQNSKALQIYIEENLDLYRGQGMDVYWRDNEIVPSEEEYKEISLGKTGSLFVLVVRLMQVFSENKTNFIEFLNRVSLFYQIRDDYMNLVSDSYIKIKNYAEDLTEGKFSFPILHAIKTRPDDHRILNIIKQKPKDYETKKKCVDLLKEFGSLDYTKQVLTEMKKDIFDQLSKWPYNPDMRDLMERTLKYE